MSRLIIGKSPLMIQGIRHCGHLSHIVVSIADRATCRIFYLGKPVFRIKIEMLNAVIFVFLRHPISESIIGIFRLIAEGVRLCEKVASLIISKTVFLSHVIRGKHNLPHGIVLKSLAVPHPVCDTSTVAISVICKNLTAISIHNL